jgi:hypothetical protein
MVQNEFRLKLVDVQNKEETERAVLNFVRKCQMLAPSDAFFHLEVRQKGLKDWSVECYMASSESPALVEAQGGSLQQCLRKVDFKLQGELIEWKKIRFLSPNRTKGGQQQAI